MIGKLFRLPQNRQFNLKPRYYDAEKERRKQRAEELKHTPRIEKGTFRKAYKGTSVTLQEQKRKANRRLLIIFVVLLVLFYLILR